MTASKRNSDNDDFKDTKPDVGGSPGKKAKVAKAVDPGRTVGAWTSAEDRALFAALYPKPKGIKWNEVADHVPGRDMQSCKNRFVVLQKKVETIF